MTPGQLALLTEKAQELSFSEEELEAAEPLIALAQDNPEERSTKLASLRRKRKAVRTRAEAQLDEISEEIGSDAHGAEAGAADAGRAAAVEAAAQEQPAGAPPGDAAAPELAPQASGSEARERAGAQAPRHDPASTRRPRATGARRFAWPRTTMSIASGSATRTSRHSSMPRHASSMLEQASSATPRPPRASSGSTRS
jgi:hypothetical protein